MITDTTTAIDHISGVTKPSEEDKGNSSHFTGRRGMKGLP